MNGTLAAPPASVDQELVLDLEERMNWKLFGSTFALIFLAELPDKTAIAVLLMASRNHPFGVFWGAAAAFLIQSVVAVSFGGLFRLLPEKPVHLAAGALFLLFAVLMWLQKEPPAERAPSGESGSEKNRSFLKTFGGAFLVIFIAEWGDLTQLATAALAARYHEPLTLLAAATLALWLATAIVATVGHHAKNLVRPALLRKAAAIVFAGIGVFMLIF